MGRYIDATVFGDYLGLTGPGDDAHLERAIATSEQEVDGYCGWGTGGFNKATGSEDRWIGKRWVRDGGRRLLLPYAIHDAAGLVVKTDEDDDGTAEITWATSDWELLPVDGSFGGITGFPFFEIRAVGDYLFPTGTTRTAVAELTSSNWGWAELPAGVISAVEQRSAQVFMRRQSKTGRTPEGFRAGGRDRDWEMELADVRHPRMVVPFA